MFGIDSSAPRIFSLPGMPEPVVVFTPRYLELTAAMRYVLAVPSSAQWRRAIARMVFSEIFAAKLVSERRVDTALRVFLASWFYSAPEMLGSQWKLRSILLDPDTTSLAAVIGYGIAHEAGHFMDATVDGEVARANVVEGVRYLLQRCLSDLNEVPERPIRLSKHGEQAVLRYAAESPGHPLNPEHVFDEVMADFFAWDTLMNLAIEMGREASRPVDTVALAGEICMQMMVLYFFERAEVVAREPSKVLTSIEAVAAHAFEDVGLVVRAQSLGHVMSQVIAQTHYTNPARAQAIGDTFRDVMIDVRKAVRPAFREAELEVDWAIKVADRGADFDNEMVSLLATAASVLAKGDSVFTSDARRFCAIVGPTDAPATRMLSEQIDWAS